MNSGRVACVYCGQIDAEADTAHIVPESLGDKGAPVGLPGACCRRCNAYFGQKVESKALRSFPFSGYRVLAAVPSKKGNLASEVSDLGMLYGSAITGCVELDPSNKDVAHAIAGGRLSELRVLAEVTEPLAVNRMLLKIGIEALAKHFYSVAVSERLSAAIDFARRPRRGMTWWSILRVNFQEILPPTSDITSGVEIREADGVLISVLTLPGVRAITPLERGREPPSERNISPPEFRIIESTC